MFLGSPYDFQFKRGLARVLWPNKQTDNANQHSQSGEGNENKHAAFHFIGAVSWAVRRMRF
jgi:hypothetical protein